MSVSTWRREPNNPYPEWSGCWMAFNNAAHRERLLSGPGYLYAIERESDHAIKIGMSHKPRERFIGFRSSYEARHDRYSLLWIVPVGHMLDAEKSAHCKLQPQRMSKNSEWFRISRAVALVTLEQLGDPVYIGRPFENPRTMNRTGRNEF